MSYVKCTSVSKEMEKCLTCVALAELFYFFKHGFVDINECLEDKNACQGGDCVNTEGSYDCTCPDGFQPNHKGCQGMSLSLSFSLTLSFLLSFFLSLFHLLSPSCSLSFSLSLTHTHAHNLYWVWILFYFLAINHSRVFFLILQI